MCFQNATKRMIHFFITFHLRRFLHPSTRRYANEASITWSQFLSEGTAIVPSHNTPLSTYPLYTHTHTHTHTHRECQQGGKKTGRLRTCRARAVGGKTKAASPRSTWPAKNMKRGHETLRMGERGAVCGVESIELSDLFS